MKPARAISLVAFLAASAASPASFELLLVPDYANDCIHRFDGGTGTYLGKFATLELFLPTALAVDQALGRVYVSDVAQARIYAFNYNTGSYLYDFAVPSSAGPYSMFVAPDGSLVMANDYGAAYRVSATTGTVLATYSRSNSVAASVMLGANNELYIAWDGATDVIQRFTLTGALLGTSTVTTNQYQYVGGGGIKGSAGFLPDWGSNSIFRFVADSTLVHQTTWTMGTMTAVNGVAFGHGNHMFAVGANASGGIIQLLNSATGFVQRSFGVIANADYGAPAIVLAPEPGTWAAGLVGIGVMVFRRFRSRTRP